MAKATAAALVVISVVSGLLAILEVVRPVYLAAFGIGALGLCGWGAAFYVAFSRRLSTPPAEALVRSIGERIPIPFLETWLRGTLLNPTAVAAYYQANHRLQLREVHCAIELTAHDVQLRVRFDGENAARDPAESCPMMMFGGSVIHLGQFPQTAVALAADGSETALHIQGVLDLGQIHYVEMIYPVPLTRGESFTLEHRHSWPGAMTDGEDTLWFPYAALFSREMTQLRGTVTFEEPPVYIKGLRASFSQRSCEPTQQQPKPTDDTRRTYEWLLDPVDNDAIYGLIFERHL